MDYELADVTHIELDRKFIFEQKIKVYIGSDLVDIIDMKKYKDPFDIFAKLQSAWIKAKLERKENDTKILSGECS